MVAFGVPAEQLAADRLRRGASDGDGMSIGVAPHMWPAARLFDAMRRTQWLWLVSPRGVASQIGLRYEALPAVARMLGLRLGPRLLEQLQVMENEALRVFSAAAETA